MIIIHHTNDTNNCFCAVAHQIMPKECPLFALTSLARRAPSFIILTVPSIFCIIRNPHIVSCKKPFREGGTPHVLNTHIDFLRLHTHGLHINMHRLSSNHRLEQNALKNIPCSLRKCSLCLSFYRLEEERKRDATICLMRKEKKQNE